MEEPGEKMIQSTHHHPRIERGTPAVLGFKIETAQVHAVCYRVVAYFVRGLNACKQNIWVGYSIYGVVHF
jgi:hypothetical protein